MRLSAVRIIMIYSKSWNIFEELSWGDNNEQLYSQSPKTRNENC